MPNQKCHRCHGTGIEPDQVMIGKTLRRLRLKKHLSQTEMAKKLHISRSMLAYLESGQRVWGADVQKKYRGELQ